MFKLQHIDQPARSLWLVGENINLGSDRSNDWVLGGLGVEAFHASIVIQADYLLLKSIDGSCLVNNRAVSSEYQLAAGDVLTLGSNRLQVVDPKTQPQGHAEPTQKVLNAPVPCWSLVADHPKLQAKDFSIRHRSVLGRSGDCTFSIPYKLLSREHAVFRLVENTLILEDLGSSNGSFVNGKRIKTATLKDGDKIAFAKLAFTVKAPDGTASPISRPADSARQPAVNKTIIRPAVDIQSALARSRQDTGRQGTVSVELATLSNHTETDAEQPRHWQYKHWLIVTLALAALCGILWFMLYPS